MKDFAVHNWDILLDWPIGTLVFVVICIFSISLLCLLGYGVFYLMDTMSQQKLISEGVIIDKDFTPAHTTLITTTVNNITTTTPVYHSAQWSLTFDINEKSDSINVTESFYKEAKIGGKHWLYYVKGRLSDNIYIKGFAH